MPFCFQYQPLNRSQRRSVNQAPVFLAVHARREGMVTTVYVLFVTLDQTVKVRNNLKIYHILITMSCSDGISLCKTLQNVDVRIYFLSYHVLFFGRIYKIVRVQQIILENPEIILISLQRNYPIGTFSLSMYLFRNLFNMVAGC